MKRRDPDPRWLYHVSRSRNGNPPASSPVQQVVCVTKHNIRVTKEMTPAFSNITDGVKFLGDFKAFDGKAARHGYHWVSLTSLLVGNCLDAKYWNFLA